MLDFRANYSFKADNQMEVDRIRWLSVWIVIISAYAINNSDDMTADTFNTFNQSYR